jgi:hypothetical protein
MAILDDPLDGFALFQFEGLGQGSGADEVELAGVVGAFDKLDFGQVAHKARITLALPLVKKIKSIFSHHRRDAEEFEKRREEKRT